MSLSTHVLLIRHGQSEGNAERRFGGHTATPLSPRGRRQAQALARALKGEELTAIYSSDLARAVETAEPLANLIGLPVNSTNAFRERSVGVMEGLTFEDAARQHPDQYAALLRRDFEHVLTGGESYRQLLDRAWQKTRRNHRGEPGRTDRGFQSYGNDLHPGPAPDGRPRRTGVEAGLDYKCELWGDEV